MPGIYDQVHGLLNTADLEDKVPYLSLGLEMPCAVALCLINPHRKDTEEGEASPFSCALSFKKESSPSGLGARYLRSSWVSHRQG